MKISPIAEKLRTNITKQHNKVKSARKRARNVTGYIAKKQDYGNFRKKLTTEYNTAKLLGKQINTNNLPFIMGAFGLLIPIPIAAPTLFIIGGLISMGIKAYNKFVK